MLLQLGPISNMEAFVLICDEAFLNTLSDRPVQASDRRAHLLRQLLLGQDIQAPNFIMSIYFDFGSFDLYIV